MPEPKELIYVFGKRKPVFVFVKGIPIYKFSAGEPVTVKIESEIEPENDKLVIKEPVKEPEFTAEG